MPSVGVEHVDFVPGGRRDQVLALLTRRVTQLDSADTEAPIFGNIELPTRSEGKLPRVVQGRCRRRPAISEAAPPIRSVSSDCRDDAVGTYTANSVIAHVRNVNGSVWVHCQALRLIELSTDGSLTVAGIPRHTRSGEPVDETV